MSSQQLERSTEFSEYGHVGLAVKDDALYAMAGTL